MRLLNTYDSEFKAEADRNLLTQAGIEAVTAGSDSATVGDSLEKMVKLSVMNDGDEAKAKAVLRGEGVENMPAPPEGPDRRHYVDIANIFIRVSAVFFMVYGLEYFTFIGEGMTWVDGSNIGFVSIYRARVVWDCVRIAFHVVGGLILIYYSDAMARAVCFDIREPRSSGR